MSYLDGYVLYLSSAEQNSAKKGTWISDPEAPAMFRHIFAIPSIYTKLNTVIRHKLAQSTWIKGRSNGRHCSLFNPGRRHFTIQTNLTKANFCTTSKLQIKSVFPRGAPSGQISEAKRVRGLPELLQDQQLKYEKSLYNEKSTRIG